MGVRPPSDDTSEPDVIEFGIAALERHLTEADVSCPADVRRLQRTLGHVEVPYDASGHTIRPERAVSEVDARTFDSRRDLLNALHPVFEAKREAAGRNLLAQLRGLVPF
jgi:hypothetical protein